jgi:hypothetical protein
VRLTSRLRIGGLIALAGLIISIGAAPSLLRAADHLDAPGTFQSPGSRHDADINDLYVFPNANRTRTVFALTTHPGLGLVTTGATRAYAPDVSYRINIDENGDAVPDRVFAWKFDAPGRGGRQHYALRVYTGYQARLVSVGVLLGEGVTGGSTSLPRDLRVFAGARSDPFFFDLDAFKHVAAGDSSRSFCDGKESDFFAPLNTNAIVLEVPNTLVRPKLNVWASTVGSHGVIDQIGRPAINTVFNSGDDKDTFNRIRPEKQAAYAAGRFRGNVVKTLEAYSATDAADGAYSGAQAGTLAGVLVPDVLPYEVGTVTVGALNGRAPADDVIDNELNLVTGGYPFDGRTGNGGIPSDCIAPHTDYLSTFPYLGKPHV